MAHSDYTPRGLSLPFCPIAEIETAIGRLSTTAQIVDFIDPSGTGVRVGSAAIIDNEIIKIGGFSDGPKIDIGYTYRVVTEAITGTGVHTNSVDPVGPSFQFLAGQTFNIAPADARFRFQVAIDAQYVVGPEITSYNTLTLGVDYVIESPWTLRILRNINTFLQPIVVRAQYRIVETSTVDTPVVASIEGQNAGTTYTLALNGGTLQAFSFIRYTLPFGGGNVNLVEGADYSRTGNVITFLVDFRPLSRRKYMQIGRGCCDTIPQEHAANAVIWFFDDFVGSDRREYGGNETIGVKPLPRTTSGGQVPVEGSPPNQITFNFRFARPYAPGKVLINGQPWFTVLTMDEDTVESLTLTWRNRNRLTQADLLVDHEGGSVTSEAGASYTIRVYNEADALVATYAGITAESWVYTKNQATIDSGFMTDAVESGYLVISAVRDGLESWQSYRVDFNYRSSLTAGRSQTLTWNVL